MHRRELGFTKACPSSASFFDKVEHIAMVQKMLLSLEHEISSVGVVATKGEVDRRVRDTLGGRKEESSM